MNCQEVVEYMHRYLDQDLDPEETAQMYRHVAVCPACAEKFNVLKSLSRDLEDLPAVTPPYSLVDSILPQLDAIDLARQEQAKVDDDKGPAVMMPELKRSRRTTSWWGSIAGRTAIGTAAAAVILGVAIFNYEPQMLSDAELPVEEVMPTSMKTGSGGSQELPESEDPNKDSGGIDKDQQQQQVELQPYAAVEDDSEKAGAEKSSPDESVSTNMDSVPVEDTKNDNKSRAASPDAGTSAREGSTKGKTGNTEPPQEAHKPTAPPSELPEPDSQGSKDIQDTQKPAETDVTVTESLDTSFDNVNKHGITGMVPEQWSSPDGLYSASLEIDQLVMYRLPAADQLPEVIHSLPLNGDWIAGEWSVDSKNFTYTVLVDQKEVKHVLNVQQPVESNKPEAEKTEKPENSDQTDKADKKVNADTPEKSDTTKSVTTP